MVKNGEKRGEERSAKLALLLAKKNRLEDLEKISKDKEYRDKLFQEFGI